MTDKEKDCTNCKHYYTDYDCREFCESRDMFEPKTMTDKHIKENKQGVLEQIAEKQKTLLDTTKAWSGYIDKNGNIY